MCQACVNDGMCAQWLFDVIDAFANHYENSSWSFGHIVIDDLNLEDHHITWCLEKADRTENDEGVEGFLRWLLTVPGSDRGMGVSG